MSFEKAAIKRFNEQSSCAPPPTKYDPKVPTSSERGCNFAHYSGRSSSSDRKKHEDENLFLTPAKPVRGRPQVVRSASVRSNSDSRLRKEDRWYSAKSLKESDTSRSVTPCSEVGKDENSERVNELEALYQESKEVIKMRDDTINSLTEEMNEYKEKQSSADTRIEELQNENETLKESLNHFETVTKQQMQEAQERLVDQKQELEQIYESTKNELESLKTQLESVETKHSSLESKFQSVNQELESKNSEINGLKATYNSIRNQYVDLQQEFKKKDMHFEELQTENTLLRENLTNFETVTKRQMMETQQQLVDQKQKLEQAYESAIVELESVKVLLDSVEAKHSTLESQFQSVSNELETKNSEIMEVKESFDSLRNQYEELQREIKQKDVQLEELKSEHGSLVVKMHHFETVAKPEMQENHERLMKQREELENMYELTKNDLESVKTQLESLQKQRLDEQQNFSNELKVKEDKIISLYADLTECKETQSLADTRLTQLQHDNDALKGSVNHFETVLKPELMENQQRLIEQKGELEQVHESVKTELESVKALLESLQQQRLDEQQNFSEQLTLKEALINSLSTEYAEKQALADALQEQLKHENCSLKDCVNHFETVTKLEMLKAQERLVEEREELKHAYKSTQSELESIKAVLESLHKQRLEEQQNFSNELALKEDMISSLSADLSEYKEKLASADALLEHFQNDNGALKESVNHFETVTKPEMLKAQEKLNCQKEELEQTLESTKHELESVKVILDNVEATHSSLEGQFQSVSKELETKNSEVMEVKESYDCLQNQYEELQGEIKRKAARLEELEGENVSLMGKIDHFETIAIPEMLENQERLIKQREELENANESTKNEIESVKALLESLEKQRLDEQQNFSDQLRLKEATINSLDAEYKEKQAVADARLEQLRNENGILTESVNHFETILKPEMLEAQKRLIEQKEELEQVYKSTKHELESVKALLESLHRQRVDEQQSFSDELATKEAAINSLTADLNECKEKQALADTRLEQLKNENVALKETVNHFETFTKPEMLEAQERLIAQRGELEQAYESTKNELESLKLLLESVQSKSSALESQFQSVSNELESKNAEILQIKATYNSIRNQYVDLQGEMKKKDGAIADLAGHLQKEDAEHKAEKHKLLTNLGQLELLLSEKQARLNEVFQTHNQMEEELQNAKAKNLENAKVIQSLSEAKEQSVLENKELMDKVESLLLENSTLKEKNHQFENVVKPQLQETIAYYERVYGDYASLVGHQNNRQKIQHVIKIKDENIKLREENTQLRQKVAELKEKFKHVPQTGSGGRRFDPSQAFKTVLKEPVVRNDTRGPDDRSTFTIPKRSQPPTTIKIVDSSKKVSKQGMSFDVAFAEETKENK